MINVEQKKAVKEDLKELLNQINLRFKVRNIKKAICPLNFQQSKTRFLIQIFWLIDITRKD